MDGHLLLLPLGTSTRKYPLPNEGGNASLWLAPDPLYHNELCRHLDWVHKRACNQKVKLILKQIFTENILYLLANDISLTTRQFCRKIKDLKCKVLTYTITLKTVQKRSFSKNSEPEVKNQMGDWNNFCYSQTPFPRIQCNECIRKWNQDIFNILR